MPELNARKRAQLPDSAFADVDSHGRRRLPINDEAHVRNALARFNRTRFESDAARERARRRILRAARRYGIVPIGFFDSQLRMEVERRRRTSGDAPATPAEQLPRGTVTFLLSDIEGSTGLLASLGDAYATSLAEVRAAHRVAVAAAGGVEVDARADEFFAAFADAGAALRAAVDIQRSLAQRTWPEAGVMRVRIGLHTGSPKVNESGYLGVDVSAAARVCSSGNGGQILASAVTERALDAGAIPDVVQLRPLGAYRLPGLPEPMELWSVTAPGVPGDDRPPRAQRAA
jgi:class 3 adenylate cyclase